jgi:predicted Zn-dependent protease
MIKGKETCLELAGKVSKEALKLGATQAEVRLVNSASYLTRFAGSTIHQNVGETNTSLTLRLVLGKRISTVSSNDTSPESIKGLVERGYSAAKVLEEDPEFISLPEPQPIKELRGLYVKETAECTPDTRAEMVKALMDEAHGLSPHVKEVAGVLSVTSSELAFVNSLGVNAYSRATLADLDTTITSRDAGVEGFGTAGDVSRNIKELDPVKIGREAAERSTGSLGARTIEVGDYEVVFEPYAVSSALGYISSGLSAQSYQDGTSWMCDLMGQKVFSEQFTLWDDGRDRSGLAFPFDLEGIPKRKLMLIEEGVPKAVVYDSYTAHKDREKSTGHAGGMGPSPSHLIVKRGDATKEEMIAETKKGILVTSFWYVRTVHAKKIIITGMTRDGTWLIENGEIKYPVKNLRFTDSLLKTFGNLELVGKEGKRMGGGPYGGMVVPSIKSRTFLFTGQTP